MKNTLLTLTLLLLIFSCKKEDEPEPTTKTPTEEVKDTTTEKEPIKPRTDTLTYSECDRASVKKFSYFELRSKNQTDYRQAIIVSPFDTAWHTRNSQITLRICEGGFVEIKYKYHKNLDNEFIDNWIYRKIYYGDDIVELF